MRYIATILLLILQATVAFSKQADTISLYFDIGISRLNEAAKGKLDSAVYYDVLIANKKLAIVGYADYLGSEESNLPLSEARSKNVQEYLIGLSIRAEDIQTVTGKGEVNRPGLEGSQGYATDRRVDIIPGGIPEPAKPVKPTVVVPTIDVSKIKTNTTIKLEKIFFPPGSHIVNKESIPEMEKLYQTLKANPTLKIQIEGHICCLTNGTYDGFDYDSEDFHLSENRAKYIYEYVVRRGIAKDRVKYAGFGKTRPLVKVERNEEDEGLNRRVEIRILER